MSKRTYSDGQIAEHLAMVDACGGVISEASRKTGVPRKTLESWVKGIAHRVSAANVANEMAVIRQEKRTDLAAALRDWAWELLVVQREPDEMRKANYQSRSNSIGIAIEKAQLLAGQPTAITQNQTDGRVLSAVDRLAAELQIAREDALKLYGTVAPDHVALLTEGKPS